MSLNKNKNQIYSRYLFNLKNITKIRKNKLITYLKKNMKHELFFFFFYLYYVLILFRSLIVLDC